MLVNYECSSWYNRVGDFFSISLGQEKPAFVQQWMSLHSQTEQPHLSGVHGQWHRVL